MDGAMNQALLWHCTVQASLCQALKVDVTSHDRESHGLDSNPVRRYLKTCRQTKKLTVSTR
jgi:hypothetical protein